MGTGALQLSRRIGHLTPDWDWVIIDCPPTLTLLTYNALLAARELLVPVAAEFLALSGTSQLTATLKVLQRVMAVVTRYDNRKRLCRAILSQLQNEQPFHILETVIRENVRLSEAPSQGTDIFRYDPKCTGAADYDALVTEILK